MTDFNTQYEMYRNCFQGHLKTYCDEMAYEPHTLSDGMRYSLLSGGKRIRPVLFYAMLDALEYDYTAESCLAIAIECIHTYSLIHDDLPAMDDDDYRRGKLTSHKVYGEGNAILFGDALLSTAMELLITECGKDPVHRRAATVLGHAAGADGMIAGQVADLKCEQTTDKDRLFFIYRHKTAKLIAAPLTMAAILKGVEPAAYEAFGEDLGILFQITDDILDSSDKNNYIKNSEENKLTCVKLFGVDDSWQLADKYVTRCLSDITALSEVDQPNFFQNIVEYIRNRVS